MLIYRTEHVNPIIKSLWCVCTIQALCEVLPVPLDLKSRVASGVFISAWLLARDLNRKENCKRKLVWTRRASVHNSYLFEEEMQSLRNKTKKKKKKIVWWLTQYGYCYGIQPHFQRNRTDFPALPVYWEQNYWNSSF